MSNFILILLCILAGIAIKRSGLLPENSHKSLNIFIIYLALPAVCFKYLPYIKWEPKLLLPAAAPIIVWLGSWLLVTLYAQINHLDKETKGALQLVTGLCNTSFVGFPLIMAYFGEQALSIAIICDQVTFLLFSTLGLIAAVRASGNRHISFRSIAIKLLRFPPFIACAAALTVPHFIDLSPINSLFDKLAGTVAPLALFSIGLQLNFEGWRQEIKPMIFALSYILFIAPLLVFLMAFVMQIKGPVAQISVFEMAMPTLLSSSLLAEEYNVKPGLVNLIIGVGIILSLITTGCWFLIVR